jgi:hypothetical protein
MKKISEAQIKAVMDLLQKYNIGVADYIAVQTMFEKLEVIKSEENYKPENTEK